MLCLLRGFCIVPLSLVALALDTDSAPNHLLVGSPTVDWYFLLVALLLPSSSSLNDSGCDLTAQGSRHSLQRVSDSVVTTEQCRDSVASFLILWRIASLFAHCRSWLCT